MRKVNDILPTKGNFFTVNWDPGIESTRDDFISSRYEKFNEVENDENVSRLMNYVEPHSNRFANDVIFRNVRLLTIYSKTCPWGGGLKLPPLPTTL